MTRHASSPRGTRDTAIRPAAGHPGGSNPNPPAASHAAAAAPSQPAGTPATPRCQTGNQRQHPLPPPAAAVTGGEEAPRAAVSTERPATRPPDSTCPPPPKTGQSRYPPRPRACQLDGHPAVRLELPDEPPRLTPAAARALLRVLVKAHAKTTQHTERKDSQP